MRQSPLHPSLRLHLGRHRGTDSFWKRRRGDRHHAREHQWVRHSLRKADVHGSRRSREHGASRWGNRLRCGPVDARKGVISKFEKYLQNKREPLQLLRSLSLSPSLSGQTFRCHCAREQECDMDAVVKVWHQRASIFFSSAHHGTCD